MSRRVPRVCKVNSDTITKQAGCSIFATFVLGSTGNPATDASWFGQEELKYGDITRPTHENGTFVLDTGGSPYHNIWLNTKVFHWFRLASSRFPWATHIAQADMDSRPYPGMLAHLLDAAQNGYESQRWRSLWAQTGYEAPPGPPPGWSENEGGIYLGRKIKTTADWMWGGLFVLSSSFLRCMYADLRARSRSHLNGTDFAMNSTFNPRLRDGGFDPMMGDLILDVAKTKP